MLYDSIDTETWIFHMKHFSQIAQMTNTLSFYYHLSHGIIFHRSLLVRDELFSTLACRCVKRQRTSPTDRPDSHWRVKVNWLVQYHNSVLILGFMYTARHFKDQFIYCRRGKPQGFFLILRHLQKSGLFDFTNIFTKLRDFFAKLKP